MYKYNLILCHVPRGQGISDVMTISRLFVLEYNSTGRIWHLSSEHGVGQQQDHGVDCYGQFDALNTIADALIDVTRQRAA